MSDVARAAGVSRQAVYLHFASRARLFMALVHQMDDEADIRARCVRALAAPDPVDALRAYVKVWLAFAATVQPIATVLGAARGTDTDAWAAWDDRMTELRSGYRHATERLEATGRLRPGLDARSAAELAWAYASVAVCEQLTLDCGWSATRLRREVPDAVVAAITGPLGPSGSEKLTA